MKKLLLVAMVVFYACHPDPSPTPPPDPTPGPTPVSCPCIIPGPEVQKWTVVEAVLPWNEDNIRKAREIVGDCSGATEGDNIKLIADELLRGNAGQSRPPICSAQWGDRLLVQNPTDYNGQKVFEEWHVVSGKTGCWASLSTAYMGAWTNPQALSCKKGDK